MILKEATGANPPVLPIPDFAEHLRLGYGFADDGTQNAALTRYLEAATSAVERHIGQAMVIRGFELQVSNWNRDGCLIFPTGPVTSLTSLRFLRGAEAVEVSPGSLAVSAHAMRQRLTRIDGGPLPPIPAGHIAEIRFDAGYGADWDGVPEALRHAVTLLAAHYFERRTPDPSPEGLPGAVAAVLIPYRAFRV